MDLNLYQKALEIKERNEKLIKDFENQITTADRDKTGLQWNFLNYSPKYQGWYDLTFATGLSHGYYGNSSCSKDSSNDAGIEICKTLNQLKAQIIQITIERLKSQIITSLEEAKEQAKEILAQSNCQWMRWPRG